MAKEPKERKAKTPEEPRPAVVPPVGEREHRATYSKDKMHGGYNIRIVGPKANRFANRTGIPVTLKDGSEKSDDCGDLLFTGTDDDTGKPYAVYKKVPKEKAADDEIPF